MAEKDQLRHREDALMKELEDAQEYMSKLEKENVMYPILSLNV